MSALSLLVILLSTTLSVILLLIVLSFSVVSVSLIEVLLSFVIELSVSTILSEVLLLLVIVLSMTELLVLLSVGGISVFGLSIGAFILYECQGLLELLSVGSQFLHSILLDIFCAEGFPKWSRI